MKKKILHSVNLFILLAFVSVNAYCIQNKTINKADSITIINMLNHAASFGWNNADSQLFYAKKALALSIETGYKQGMLKAYLSISSGEYINGNYTKGLQAAIKALKLSELLHDDVSKRAANNSIGLLYQQMRKYKESIPFFLNAIQLLDTTKNFETYSSTANNIANSYMNMGDVKNMFKYRKIALNLRKKYGQLSALADSYNDLGEYYSITNMIDSAEYYFKICYKIKDSIGDLEMTALSSLNLGSIYLKKKDYKNATFYLLRCKEIAQKISAPYYLQDALYNLVKVYESKKDISTENILLKELIQLKDSLYNVENQKQLNRLFTEFETEKKELEIKNLKITQEEEQKRNRLVFGFFVLGIILLILFLLFVVNRYRIIRNQKIKIEEQKKVVEVKNKEILDSINYASIIQRALITEERKIKEFILKKLHLSDYFIFFKPKDVVSGDFYWATSTENGFYLAVCDSTGHGVPGAFMSLLNINLLNEAINVRGLEMPNEIFSFIRQQLIQNISHVEEKKDGMDGTLFYFQYNNNYANLYTSAFNAPLIIRNKEMVFLDCDRIPVGKSDRDDEFSLFTIKLRKDDWLYAFSDGFSDQFGGKDKKRLKKKAFYSLLADISIYSGEVQKQKLQQFLSQWMEGEEQVDDILIVGIKA
ncbi:MAG TPA: SpoIIE family protein phosphatase [Bacteroidales bacterium]|jgi:serine phosphatase RsbU (regulator of sigma subunit)|nr:SpoIIE family protein phosphatase [Bacteroidales bacterium]HOU97823.1 SpoIIE family protein phosphatase [Bacteroidales bacterium]